MMVAAIGVGVNMWADHKLLGRLVNERGGILQVKDQTMSFRTICAVAVIVVMGWTGISALGEDEKKPDAAGAGAKDGATQFAEFMKMAAPGPEHEKLAQWAGEWDAACKFFAPDGGPMGESNGVMHGEMVLGGRYLQLKYDGNMATPNGPMPFHGMGLGGFDKMKQKYCNVWVDEMSTSMMTTEGTMQGDVLTMDGQSMDPMTHKPMKVQEVIKQVDKDHHSYELHMSGPEGKMMKVMEIMYTRKG
jgi:hypothetical protein